MEKQLSQWCVQIECHCTNWLWSSLRMVTDRPVWPRSCHVKVWVLLLTTKGIFTSPLSGRGHLMLSTTPHTTRLTLLQSITPYLREHTCPVSCLWRDWSLVVAEAKANTKKKKDTMLQSHICAGSSSCKKPNTKSHTLAFDYL